MRYFEVLNESKSPAAAEAILKRNGKQLYDRAEVDQTCPDEVVSVEEDNGKYVLQHIMDADPTPKGIYVNWIVREYLKGNIARFEDLGGRVYAALERYNALKPKLAPEQKDIMRLTWEAVQSIVEDHVDTDVRSETQKEKEFERDLINTGQAKIVQNDSNMKIIEVHSEDAAKFYGRNTRWCTAADRNNMFDSYYRENEPLIVLLFKKENKRYQLHFASDQYMDEMDKPIPTNEVKGLLNNSPYLREQAIWSGRLGHIDSLAPDEIEKILGNPTRAFRGILSNTKLAKLLGPNINRMFTSDYISMLDNVDDIIVKVAGIGSDLMNDCPLLKPSDFKRLFETNAEAMGLIHSNSMSGIMQDSIYVDNAQDRREYMTLLSEIFVENAPTLAFYEHAFHFSGFQHMAHYEEAISIYGSVVEEPFIVSMRDEVMTSYNRDDLAKQLIEKQTPITLMGVAALYNSMRNWNDMVPLPAKDIAQMNITRIGSIPRSDTTVFVKDDLSDMTAYCPRLMNEFVDELIRHNYQIKSIVKSAHKPLGLDVAARYHSCFASILAFFQDYINENGYLRATQITDEVPKLKGFLKLANVEIGGGTIYPFFMMTTNDEAKQLGIPTDVSHIITEQQLLDNARRSDAGESPYDGIVCGVMSGTVDVLSGQNSFDLTFGDVGVYIVSDGNSGFRVVRIAKHKDFPDTSDIEKTYPSHTEAAKAVIAFAKRIRKEAED